jgi:shikimate dehydrogenase
LILGIGGTSLTVQKCAKDEGAKKIAVAYRGHNFNLDKDAEIIVNTTPVGMFPNNGEKIINLEEFPKCEGVLDVVYNPLLTDILLRAKEYGLPNSGGLPMLVAQATAAAKLFAGTNYEDQNEEILRWLLDSIKNIVLIGMPGSGKSTIGKLLTNELEKNFVDLDEVIAQKAGMPVTEIFAKHGEAFFRNLETEACKEYGKQKNLVIATGGGAVLRKENMDALMQNGETFFLDRNINNLAKDGRPLSANFEAVQKLYEDRLPLYQKCSDHKIVCTENIEAVKNEVAAICSGVHEGVH